MSEELRSPIVNADRSVTVNLMSTHATRVRIGGDLRFGRARVGPRQPDVTVPMVQSAPGVWSCTSEPAPPGVYRYFMVVDGLRTLDPLNPWKSYVVRGDVFSVVQVSGATAMPWEVQPAIPHGTVVLEKVYSPTLKQLMPCAVYLPAGYDATERRYPVLYLLHGGGGDYLEWLFKGYVDNVLDALFAQSEGKEMVVVMPEGHLVPAEERLRARAAQAPGAGSVPPGFRVNFSDRHVRYLVDDVLPYVEGKYRIAADQRVIAGLSMGSAQSLNVAMAHPDLFQALGVFSGGALLLDRVPQAQDNLKRIPQIYLSCGIYDTLVDGERELHTTLEALEIPHTYVETDDGGHIWQVWRNALPAFLCSLK